ncbi:MAG: S-layer homology domain-containing protein [Clostridiaceae bacterium]
MKQKAKGIISLILMLALGLTMFIPAYAANSAEAEIKAEALKQLGLFKGVSDTDFDLKRTPTRTEALVMLIRVLGRESEALNGTFTHPFTDVQPWADKYVGYAYEKGLTKGISATEFGVGSASSDMYLTFVLRALGYDDLKGDFTWDEPDTLAAAVGILPGGVDTENFLRADVALVSWEAVKADMKGGSQTLAKKLISESIFSSDDYAAAQQLVNEQAPKSVSVSTAGELQAALTDSTVKAVTIDSIGTPVVVTGKLTISEGVTLTVNRGNDFYIEGTLTNNGTIRILGADSVSNDFINYSVMSVKNGGKVINNGALRLCAAKIGDTEDRGPVGGQLRVFDGTLNNAGSVYLEAGIVNTHGGVTAVVGGTFTNDATVVVDGFFLRIESGSFINNTGAVVINNTNIITEGTGVFTNNGTLSGKAVNG